MAASHRCIDLQQDEDRFYLPGDAISDSRHQPSHEVRLLQEIKRVLSSLVWIADRIVDERLSDPDPRVVP